MNKTELQGLLQKKYDPSNWDKVYKEVFKNYALFEKPADIHVSEDWVKSFRQKGWVSLQGNQKVAIFEVVLQDGISVQSRRVALRQLVSRFIDQYNTHGVLAIFDNGSPEYRFTFAAKETRVTRDEGIKTEETESKRYTYILGESESCKTAAEQLYSLGEKAGELSLGDLKDAFAVEKLSKQFFAEYKEHYLKFTGYLESNNQLFSRVFNGDGKQMRDFVKLLLGRLVFLQFVQKKRWMGAQAGDNAWKTGSVDFLASSFGKFQDKDRFYADFLEPLFYQGLSKSGRPDELFSLTGTRVPYLNGGLFENQNPATAAIQFPAAFFQDLFDFFGRYNFTIDENDPAEQEVGIDPEMLGSIFENLLEDNKDKGAFYTPKEIVHYMCRESLIEYLNTRVNTEADAGLESGIRQLVTEHKTNWANAESQAAELATALRNIKVCDPAIGSGAFPMGMLMEIFYCVYELYHAFPEKVGRVWELPEGWKPHLVKNHIIQNSIYGVDIEKGAVDIARLRFWLSLVVDEETPRALPNLDYKIIVGNSLLSKLGDTVIDIHWDMKSGTSSTDEFLKQIQLKLKNLQEKQRQFFSTQSDKKSLQAEIRNLKIELLLEQLKLEKTKLEINGAATGSILPSGRDNAKIETAMQKRAVLKGQIEELEKLKDQPEKVLEFFDWKLDFPEVLNELINLEPGFDVVIGNPPYGATLKDTDISFLRKRYSIKTSETAILFIEKGINLGKSFGVKTYIIPKSFTFASNYSKIRDFVEDEISFIVDCGRSFDNVRLEACIISVNKGRKLSKYKSLLFKPDKTFQNLALIDKELKSIFGFFPNGITDIELRIGNKIFQESIWLNEISSNSRGAMLQKHLLKTGKYAAIGGKEIDKFGIRSVKGFLREISLINEKAFLKPNSIIAQNIVAHIANPYEHIKIIACVAQGQEFVLLDTINQISINNKNITAYYIWCLLSSKLVNWYVYLFILGKAIRTIHFDSPITSRLPIHKKSEFHQDIFKQLYNEILTHKSQGKSTFALEQQVDNLVYRLYDLSLEEVKIIDPDFPLSEAEYLAIKLE